ncbi:MAG: hypothetical protein ABJA67_10970 [Chthonomonadales bacterium]
MICFQCGQILCSDAHGERMLMMDGSAKQRFDEIVARAGLQLAR